jgi:hypothetical protein
MMADYHRQYLNVSAADSLLAGVAIRGMVRYDEKVEPILGQLDSGLVVATGGVIKGAKLIEPTLSETAKLRLSDSTPENVQLTYDIVEKIKRDDPEQAHWLNHATDMENHHPKWGGGLGRVATMATFGVADLRTLAPRSAQVVAMEYGAESAFAEREDYVYAIGKFAAAAEVMLYMAYTVGSGGYAVGERNHPAYPVTISEAAELIERSGFNLITDPEEGFAPASKELRQEGDPHDYDGFAALVAIRK